MKKYVKFRHRFFFALMRPTARIIARKFCFKTKAKKLKKGENYLILSNHQSYLEPAFIALTFKRPIYFVASDSLYSKKWYSRLLFHCFGPIKKRRGFTDVTCMRTMCGIAREGGMVAVFPEGNRQWNDSQFYIDRAVVKLIRLIKLPVVLYNFRGGYGVNPRWGKTRRKGKHVGVINKIIPWQEVCAMTDDELYAQVVAGLKVIDSASGELYKSPERAEYLERQLFVCPKCHSYSTLHSQGAQITCSHCGMTATYGENLLLTSADPEFPFTKVVDWYRFQQQTVRNAQIPDGEVLVSDEDVTLYDKTERDRVTVATGKLELTAQYLSVGSWRVSTADIYGGCAQDGTKLSFNIGNRAYIIFGHERFNSIKYLLYFNRVCKQISEKGGDDYYGLNMDPAQL